MFQQVMPARCCLPSGLVKDTTVSLPQVRTASSPQDLRSTGTKGSQCLQRACCPAKFLPSDFHNDSARRPCELFASRWGLEPVVVARLDAAELLAEKVRALVMRMAGRDIFDVYWLLQRRRI